MQSKPRAGHEKLMGFHGGMKRPGGSRGHDYYNRINSIRSSYATSFKRRRLMEEQDDKPVSAYLNKAERVNWYIKENGRSHKTIKYDLVHDQKESKPVLRRGQVFRMSISFRDRDFNVERDRCALIFKFGAKPSVQKGTMAVVAIKNDKFTKTKDDWDVKIETESAGKELILKVHIPANAPVGIWRLDVRSGLQAQYQDNSKYTHSDETDIYILFNPWCKDDGVYMEDVAKLEEYVMNDNGKIYKDTHKRPRGRPWAFGQFDDVVLPVASYILELSRLSDSERGNPVRVVRAIAAAVNHYDEGGIMEGKWEGDYQDGMAPDMWTGTVRILEEYVNNGYRPVKYGQCWVFSAVVTSLCRSIGIPCRSVTNFVSAHDTNSSLTIDNFFDKEGHKIEGGPDGDNTDSIWNFHCWNDAWMARPDLPKGYGGWQAIDATPQEESSSMCNFEGKNKMQCGPASLEAVRRGDVGLGYDVPYIYSEVNADVMNWGEDQECDWGFQRMKMDKYEVGRCILTKRPGKEDDSGNTDKEDITAQYKNKEGAETERMTVHNAIRGCRRARQYYEYKTDVKEDVQFDLYELEKIEIGQPFQVKVVVRNQSNEHRTVSTSLTASSVYYTSVHHSTLKRSDSKFKLGPQQQQDVVLTVQFNEYWKKLVEGCLIKIYIICRVEETGQTYTEEDDFVVEKPRLQIGLMSQMSQSQVQGQVSQQEWPTGSVPGTCYNMFAQPGMQQFQGDVKERQSCQVTFSFKNPLDTPLTNCHLSVDGSGLMRPRSIAIEGDVDPEGQFTYTMRFRPRIHGDRKIVASFYSKELFDINGVKSFNVKKQ